MSNEPHMSHYLTGQVREKRWLYSNDYDPNFMGTDYHRKDDGPAYQNFYEDGQVCCEAWYNNKSKVHRWDAPAEIIYHQDGTIKSAIWYINGTKLDDDEAPDHWPLSIEEQIEFKLRLN